MELRNNLQDVLGITLPATLVFDYPSVETLARFLNGRVTSKVSLPVDRVGPHKGSEQSSVLVELQHIVRSTLGMEVPPHVPLMAAGLDSLGE